MLYRLCACALALVLFAPPAPAQTAPAYDTAPVFERGPTKEEIDAIFGAPGDGAEPGRITRGLRAQPPQWSGTRPVDVRIGNAYPQIDQFRERPRQPARPVLPPRGKRALNIAIQFEFDSASLLLREGDKLSGLVAWLRENRSATLLIAGHADATGARSYNFGLSARRAAAVRAYLVEARGIEAGRLTSAGYGELFPLIGVRPTDPLNRRVAFHLVP